jgi:hypothetical protein
MTNAHWPHRRFRVAAYLALTVLASGCQWLFPPSAPPAPTPSQSAVLDASKDYDIGPEHSPIVQNDPAFPGPTAPDAAAPTIITIATMTLKPSHTRGSRRLLARITSNRDYPLLGVYEGQNFVWRNTWDSTAVSAPAWINTVTSTSPGKPDHTLTRDNRSTRYPPFDAAHQPSLFRLTVRSIAFVVCLDDPMCGTGHCGNF